MKLRMLHQNKISSRPAARTCKASRNPLSVNHAGMWAVFWVCLALSFSVGCVRQPDLGDKRVLKSRARSRLGFCPSPIAGVASFVDPEDIGRHTYAFSPMEKSGIVYTSRGGHIDIGHVRKAADWTAYLAELTYEKLQQRKTTFSFKQKEPAKYFVTLQYPQYWGDLDPSTREDMGREVAITLGQYFAFLGSTWHEIVTWFGYNSSGVISEFPSAFSWEDTFSNLLGTRVAMAALHDHSHGTSAHHMP